MKRFVLAVLLLALVAAGGAAFVAWRDLASFRETPYGDPEEKVVVVPPGASARVVIRTLARGGVLSDERTAWRYFRYVKRDPRAFRSGEYAFAGPLRPDEVLERVFRGDVKLYRFTVPEGLRMEEIAAIVARSGLAAEAAFLEVARDPAVARGLGLPYANLEGFLFPDTYSFPRGASARAIAAAMVARFDTEYAKAEAVRAPGVSLDRGRVATLASIVEKETGREDERPRIACVFHNRLRLGMPLQTDPTVMYATMLRTGRWSRNITRTDLLTPHPYNTYTTAGLPPGPIASAGAAALRAALAPADCKDLYFVSRNDGSHVFCPDLACHNAAVQRWQVEFFRRSAR
ncbi:endolytic transglycosylase MltG [Anaeromyxobacter sp. Fw109-5]|uniref:endolytic transglycosylase MltG n=1 Tax=Anaeromyxobacter sp. (strain Fw109-5) TaxID=404589 RepID=UPI00030A5918|nr:endolytic transglycosylase MltG [Anaeromyxobacter sp. Fw109-5]